MNGIINEVIQTKSSSIDIQILDYAQCFDSLSLEECMNDIYDAGVKNDNFALIYRANENNKVAVKTPFGFSEREDVSRIVLQGETLGPLLCSVQVDTFGKECIAQGKYLYYYHGTVPIPPLGMVDDVIAVSKCGLQSVEVNAFLNTKTNLKQLQYGHKKCKKMHVGALTCYCPDLYIDKWKLDEVSQANVGIRSLEDVHDGQVKIEESNAEKYLGDIIDSSGSNLKI